MGLGDTLKKHTDPDVLLASMQRLGVSVSTALNPNHRHDEKHEKEEDRKRQAICESHRFLSFAGQREGNAVKWYSCGHDYFYALSIMLEEAKQCIFILDWWLSPELYLRRPPALHEEWRLDRILKRKAEQGVKIFVIVYKEVTQTMTMSSAHTKHHLEGLHPNIKCFRHPDHLGGEITLFWSHHEKVVVVDNERACIGGLDLCFGRWDTQSHALADVHPTAFERTVFPGQDFNNARVEDFQHVDDFMSNQQSKLELGRMPWQDVHCTIHGEAALDVAHHFVERWNFVKRFKYRSDRAYGYLAFPHGADPADDVDPRHDAVRDHPHTAFFHQQGEKFKHPFHQRHVQDPSPQDKELDHAGNMSVQVVRSSADWSSGILKEHSIQNAYVELIRCSSHFIYIENQFFITATETGGTVTNQIGAALVERIISAHQDGRRFKVIIVIPTIPCFAGELDAAAGIRCIMAYQYASINRRGKSIMEQIQATGIDPNEYISFYNLRGYDRINNDIEMIKQMEQKSGVTFHQAEVAAARLLLGEQGLAGVNMKVAIKNPLSGNDAVDSEGKAKAPVVEEVDLPKTEAEAQDIIKRFQDAAPRSDVVVRDSIASNILHGQPDTKDEPWVGTDESEKAAFVTEETYIHSKLMIVDDRIVLIGSANLNERSQKGDGDSEIAVVIEDRDLFESKMDGQKYMAAKFAASFRRHLWRQHLGLVEPQECTPEGSKHYPLPGMLPAPAPLPSVEVNDEYERLVEDPLSPDLEKMWKGQARTNTDVYDELFHVVPTDKVRDWATYNTHFPKPPIKTGHLADPTMDLQYVKGRLSEIRGSLVELPLHFLENEKLERGSRGLEVNPSTLAIYL